MARRFSPDPIDPGRLERVLRAGLAAPSAGNTRGVDLLCLVDPVARRRFWQAASDASWREGDPQAAGLLDAPAIVLPLADPAAYLARYAAPDKARARLAGRALEDWPVPYWLVDAAFAAMLVLLAATDVGLGALFFQVHGDEAALLAALGVPPGRRSIGAIALGEALGEARPSRRAPARRRVHLDRWSAAPASPSLGSR